MNRQVLALPIPILALAIPVAAVILGGLHKIAKLRLEEARLRLQERVDFAERLLARPQTPAGPSQHS